MARDEVDREDLLRDAAALVRRIELSAAGESAPVVVGFRAGGAASYYFGADPAYHFNTQRELRRAYVDDRLVKADRGRLVALRRNRTDQAVELLRTEWTDAQSTEFVQTMQSRLMKLHEAVQSGAVHVVGEVPEGGNVLKDVRTWLNQGIPSAIAKSPHAR